METNHLLFFGAHILHVYKAQNIRHIKKFMTKKWLKDSDVELRAKSPREEWFFISATASGAPKNHHFFLLSPSMQIMAMSQNFWCPNQKNI